MFYTPRYITKYIVENTVGALCREQKAALAMAEEDYTPDKRKQDKKAALQKLDDYRAWLLRLTICDPACGSGAFLNAALEFLIAEHRYVDELTNKLTGASLAFRWTPNDILEHNLFGVDINDEAVEIARLSLWLRTAQKGRKLSNLSGNIKVGNSLIDDKAVAGEKAFCWKEEFPAVFERGGFDVVIGNPPYGVIEKKDLKSYFKKNFESFQGNLENYCFFTERFIQIAKTVSGAVGLIISITWLTIPQFENLRKVVLSHFIENIVELPTKIFSDADLDTLICLLRKRSYYENSTTTVAQVQIPNALNFETCLNQTISLKQSKWVSSDGFRIDLHASEQESKIVNRLKNSFPKIKKHFRVSQGIVPYAREEFYKHMPKEVADEIVDKRLWHSEFKIDEFFKKELKGEDVGRYYLKWNGKQWVKYGDWLARPRSIEFFNSPRILIREITRGVKLNAAFTEEEYYNNPGIINIISSSNSINLLKCLLGIINSSFAYWYHLRNSPKANLTTSIPQILIKDVENLPIPDEESLLKSPLSEKVNVIISQTDDFRSLLRIFLTFLQNKFPTLLPTNKLADWPQLSFKEFLKELEKQKLKLSLAEQAEWLPYFEGQKQKAAALQQLIRQTDKEIDNMVYTLYGLAEEEIRLVESA